MDVNNDLEGDGTNPVASEVDDEVRSIAESPQYKRQSLRLEESKRFSGQLVFRNSLQGPPAIAERSLADEKKLQDAHDEWIVARDEKISEANKKKKKFKFDLGFLKKALNFTQRNDPVLISMLREVNKDDLKRAKATNYQAHSLRCADLATSGTLKALDDAERIALETRILVANPNATTYKLVPLEDDRAHSIKDGLLALTAPKRYSFFFESGQQKSATPNEVVITTLNPVQLEYCPKDLEEGKRYDLEIVNVKELEGKRKQTLREFYTELNDWAKKQGIPESRLTKPMGQMTTAVESGDEEKRGKEIFEEFKKDVNEFIRGYNSIHEDIGVSLYPPLSEKDEREFSAVYTAYTQEMGNSPSNFFDGLRSYAKACVTLKEQLGEEMQAGTFYRQCKRFKVSPDDATAMITDIKAGHTSWKGGSDAEFPSATQLLNVCLECKKVTTQPFSASDFFEKLPEFHQGFKDKCAALSVTWPLEPQETAREDYSFFLKIGAFVKEGLESTLNGFEQKYEFRRQFDEVRNNLNLPPDKDKFEQLFREVLRLIKEAPPETNWKEDILPEVIGPFRKKEEKKREQQKAELRKQYDVARTEFHLPLDKQALDNLLKQLVALIGKQPNKDVKEDLIPQVIEDFKRTQRDARASVSSTPPTANQIPTTPVKRR
ncbi:MAG: hypothetical protein V4568_18445 [Pseudomonadota bacterium]